MNSQSQILIFAISIGVGIVCVILMGFIPSGLAPLAVVFAVLALLSSIVAFATKDYLFLFEPFTKMKHMNIVIEESDPFYMAQSGNAIVVRRGNDIFATAFIKIPIYSTATEMDDDQKYNFAILFARLVSISKTPMRLSSQLHAINKDEYLARINAKLNESEGRYNVLQGDKNADPKALDRVKGEVTMWRNMLDNVSRSNSQQLGVYASVSAAGNSEDEAINMVSVRAEEIAAGISTTLGVSANVMSGNEILVFTDPDKMIPPATISEIMKYKNTQAA